VTAVAAALLFRLARLDPMESPQTTSLRGGIADEAIQNNRIVPPHLIASLRSQ
jgi:hypothetical protein